MTLPDTDLASAIERAEDHIVMHHQCLTNALLDHAESGRRVERERREHARAIEHVQHLRYLADEQQGLRGGSDDHA